MEDKKILHRRCKLLTYLSGLPRKMLTVQGVDNISDCVLHDLCHKECFNLRKVAYFIDNPDFDCIKGVVGFSQDEVSDSCDCIWDRPHELSAVMRKSSFNKKVRDISHCSIANTDVKNEQIAQELADRLGFSNHAFCSWNMKHDNHGFVLYEKVDKDDSFADDHILDGLSLLSFCPVF